MKNKKSITIILIVIIIIAGAIIYLNRSYAYIYSKFDLTQAPVKTDYVTSETLSEKSQLLTYVAIGDSLTAGVGATSIQSSLPALLAEKISAEKGLMVRVKNLGVPGATSFDILTGQVLDASELNPQIITLFIGTNDMHNFVPVEKFKSNLLTAIGALQRTTKAEIYLVNLPYLGASDLVLPPYNLYFEMKLEKYNSVIAQVASETGVKLIDLHSASDKVLRSDSKLYCADRFHPSDYGYTLWADAIAGYFK